MCINYEEFLKTKAQAVPCCGFSVAKDEMNPAMFEWQKDIAGWAFKKGKAALFEDCGLGKTIQQLEWTRIVAEKTGEPCLILAPLAVSRQTKKRRCEIRLYGKRLPDAGRCTAGH